MPADLSDANFMEVSATLSPSDTAVHAQGSALLHGCINTALGVHSTE